MSTKLLVFGDSWPAGAELKSGQLAFPALLGQLLEIEVEDLSESATSIDCAVYKLLNLNFKSLQNCKILFCLTDYSRSFYFEGDKIKQLRANHRNESLNYYAKLYSEKLGQLNLIKNLLLVQELCAKYNIPLYFIFNWNKIPNHPLLNKNLFYQRSLCEILDIVDANNDESPMAWYQYKKNKYIYPNICHPNEDGHQLIANTLKDWIA